MNLTEIKKEIKKSANPQKAELLQRFFKTGPGQYGEGDIFLGIMVPVQRSIAKKFKQLPLKDLKELLYSDKHEERLISLLILVEQFRKGDDQLKEEIFTFYHLHRKRINNWDLVDLTAHIISGSYLMDKDKTILYKLADSKNISFAILTGTGFKETLKKFSFLGVSVFCYFFFYFSEAHNSVIFNL